MDIIYGILLYCCFSSNNVDNKLFWDFWNDVQSEQKVKEDKAKNYQVIVEEERVNYPVYTYVCEDTLIEQVLVALYHQESITAGGYKAVGYNTNGTVDYGKYQINSTNLYKYGINPYEFLNNPSHQEWFARFFMKVHIDFLKYHNKPIDFKRLKIAWGGIAYALY